MKSGFLLLESWKVCSSISKLFTYSLFFVSAVLLLFYIWVLVLPIVVFLGSGIQKMLQILTGFVLHFNDQVMQTMRLFLADPH
jgi:hypothetical protein